jgi:hypothetical protein
VYQIAERKDNRALTDYLAQHGQMLLPMVELIEQAQLAVDEFIDVLGRAALEAVLELSAAQVAGPPHQGQAGGAVRRHGSQPGSAHGPGAPAGRVGHRGRSPGDRPRSRASGELVRA